METTSKPYKLALVDARVYKKVNSRLELYAEKVVPFRTESIAYNAVSCHVDVFVHETCNGLVVAPNIPTQYLELFDENGINYTIAKNNIGDDLVGTTTLNCLSKEGVLLHKKGYTDPVIIDLNKENEFIQVPNAYTRCTTIVIKRGVAITSDRGIEKALLQKGWEVCYFSPEKISIEDHSYGFFGGCSGYYHQQLFTLGDVKLHADGAKLNKFLQRFECTLVPLCEESLIDGGGVFLLK